MPRVIPDQRFEELIRTATEIFIAQGYRRTQMADVAQAMGLAKGTMYLYVESKEALFDLVVRHANRQTPTEVPSRLPLPTPKPHATVEYVAKALAAGQSLPMLAAALERQRSSDVRRELEGILRELYGVLSHNRVGLKLIDRCAQDHPDLAALWFKGGREYLLNQLVSYLQMRQRRLRKISDFPIAARIVLENLVLWAVHRHWDPSPQVMDEKVAEDTLIELLLDGLIKEQEQ
jgi:AcrR family transcriptional regulator